MIPEDTDLFEEIEYTNERLVALYAARRRRFVTQLSEGLSFREVGEYWGITRQAVVYTLDLHKETDNDYGNNSTE